MRESAKNNKRTAATIRKRHKNGGNFRIAGVSEFHGPAVAIIERGTCEMIAWTFEPERVKRGLDLFAALEAGEIEVIPAPERLVD